MHRRRWHSPLVGMLLLVSLVAVPPAVAQDLDDVRARRAELQERLDQAARDLDAVETRTAELEGEVAGLAQRVRELEAELADTRERIAGRVRDLYKRRSSSEPLLALFSGDDAEHALDRAAIVDRLVAGDRRDTEMAEVARTEVETLRGRLASSRDALAAEQQRHAGVLAELRDDLEEAKAIEERLEREERERREAEARRRAAAEAAASSASGGPVAATSGGTACPVGRPRSYSDTWGAPRSGGRSHKGTDILSPYGTPVYAIVSGVWDVRSYGRSAGHWAILRGDNGHQYWYMHLQSHVVGDGARVSAGQQTGTNGDTGNAVGTPHVHFEYHPGGGGPVNPYPVVRRACG